ncbi:MAG: MarR family winged helix-turn-helix transcriptional regulator [Candidatus Aenigmatarchaeota archaeon]
MPETNVEELFFRKKPIKLFLAMAKGENSSMFVSILAKKTDCTYSHTVKLLEQFRQMGYVTFEKKGRVKYITLTDDGKKMADAMMSVMRLMHKKKSK